MIEISKRGTWDRYVCYEKLSIVLAQLGYLTKANLNLKEGVHILIFDGIITHTMWFEG